MLNSIGLQNPGVEAFCAEALPWLAAQGVPVIVNVCAHDAQGYAQVIERLEQEPAVSAYELNISCPNVSGGGMAFGTSPTIAASVVAACRPATARPLIVKLTPNVTDIVPIAQAVETAGADALSLINTVCGMAIDVRTRKSILERGVGGLSGPAIKPIALYLVNRCYHAVSVPIIGMGGICNATDAVEFMLAGATAVAVGTANFTEPLSAPQIAADLAAWCADQGVAKVSELRGALR
jgi:dihydroorotate dehydrogenase (NAD+) catalytic subunit